MMRPVHPFFLIFFLLFSSSPLFGQDKSVTVLENIAFEKKDNKGETIRFKLNGNRIPKVFFIKGKKPRVVFDFFDTRFSDLVKHTINTRGNLIQRIRVGVHHKPKPKTRVVVDLVPELEIDVEKRFIKEENILEVTFLQVGQGEETKQDTDPPKEKDKKEPQPVTPASVMEKESGGEVKEKVVVKKSVQSAGDKLESSPDKPKDTTNPFLNAVTFENTSNKGEMVLFKLNDFYPPIVFGLEKGKPRVVCDFLDTALNKDVKKVINSNGKFVKRIRLAQHKNPDKIRVVLDLVPDSNYDLQQVFFKEDNLFVIIINPFVAGDKTEDAH